VPQNSVFASCNLCDFTQEYTVIFNAVSQKFPNITDLNHGKIQSVWLVSGQRFDSGTTGLQSRSTRQCTRKFGS